MPPKKSLRQRTLSEVVVDGIKRRAATVPKHIVADTSTSSLSTELEEEGNVREQATTSTQVVDNASGFQSDEEIVANGPNEVIVYPVTFEEFQQYTNCVVRVRQIMREMWRTHKSLMEQEQRMCADMEGKWLQSMYERFYTHPLSMRERANLTLKKCSTQMRKKLLARASIKVLTTKTNEDNGSKPLRSIENAAVKRVRKKRKQIVQENSSSESDTGDLSSPRKMVRVTVVDSSSDELQLTAAAMVTQHKEASLPHEYVLSDTEEFNPTDVRSSPVVIEEKVEVKSVEIAPGDNFTVNWLQFIIEPDLNSSSAQFPVTFQTFTHCSRKTEIVDNLVNALKLEHGIDLTNDEILKERIFKNYYKQFYTNPSIRERFPMIFIPCPTCVKQKILRMPQENETETTLPSDTNANVPVIAAPSTEQCMVQQEPVDDNQSQGNQSRGAKTQFLHKSIDQEFIANYIQVRGGKNPQKLAVIYERLKKEVLHQQSEEKTPEKEKVQILSVENLCGPCLNISENATTSAPATEGQIQTYTYVERAKKLLSHKVDKLQTLPFLVRYYDGMKRTILSAIMQMTIEEFQRYTLVHGAPDIYSDVEALRYCFAVALVEPRVWPVHLYMRLVDLHHYLQSKQVEYEQLDLQHVSPKLLHWEELVATTNFDECVRFDYCKCTGETLNGEELLCERRENYYRRCWAHDQWLWQTPIVNETTLEQLKAVTVSDSGNQGGAADMHESTSSSSATLQELSYSTFSETDDEGGPAVDTEANAIEEGAVVEQSAAELANNHADDMLVDIPSSSSVCDPEDELKRMMSPSTSEHIEISSQDGAELPNFAVVDMPNTQAQIEALLADGDDTLNTPPLTNTTTEEDRLVPHPVPSPMQKPQAPVTSPKEAKLSELSASAAVVKQELLPLKDLQFNLLNDEDHFECVPATDDLIVIESESMANCFDQLSPFMPIVSPTDLTSHHLQSQLSLCGSGSMTEGQQLLSSLDISQQQQQPQVQEKEQTETENRAAATQLQENLLTLQEKKENVMKKSQENKKAQTLQTLEKTQQQQGQQNSLTDGQQKSRQSCEQKKEHREQQQLQQSKKEREESLQIEQQYLQKGQQQRKEERQELQTDQQQRKQKEQQQQREQRQQNQQRQPIEQLQQPKDRLQQQQKQQQQQQRHKEQQQQLKVQLQKEMEQQQRLKEKQQQKQQPLEKPQQSSQQPHKLQQPKERLQQPKAQLQQQQKQQLQQQNEEQQKPQQQQAQLQCDANKPSSKSIVTKRAISNEFITVRKASAPTKTKRKPVDTIVPQLTHEFRALQLLPASEVAKASKVVPAATQPMVTINTNVQSFSNDTSLFNNTNLLRMVDQSKPQSQQRSPQPARQLHKQVNNKTNAVGSTSGRHQSMVYRKLEIFDYFGQLTVDHITQYQLHCIGIGQPYMRARVKCADGRRTFLYGDVLGALFARCPAPLLRDVQRLLDELGEFHYTSRRSAYAGRPTKAVCDDLRASVLCQFMRSAPIFTYAHLRPDCDLWQRVEPVSPVTDETLVRQPHCSDLSAALLGSTLVRIAEFKSKNRAPL